MTQLFTEKRCLSLQFLEGLRTVGAYSVPNVFGRLDGEARKAHIDRVARAFYAAAHRSVNEPDNTVAELLQDIRARGPAVIAPTIANWDWPVLVPSVCPFGLRTDDGRSETWAALIGGFSTLTCVAESYVGFEHMGSSIGPSAVRFQEMVRLLRGRALVVAPVDNIAIDAAKQLGDDALRVSRIYLCDNCSKLPRNVQPDDEWDVLPEWDTARKPHFPLDCNACKRRYKLLRDFLDIPLRILDAVTTFFDAKPLRENALPRVRVLAALGNAGRAVCDTFAPTSAFQRHDTDHPGRVGHAKTPEEIVIRLTTLAQFVDKMKVAFPPTPKRPKMKPQPVVGKKSKKRKTQKAPKAVAVFDLYALLRKRNVVDFVPLTAWIGTGEGKSQPTQRDQQNIRAIETAVQAMAELKAQRDGFVEETIAQSSTDDLARYAKQMASSIGSLAKQLTDEDQDARIALDTTRTAAQEAATASASIADVIAAARAARQQKDDACATKSAQQLRQARADGGKKARVALEAATDATRRAENEGKELAVRVVMAKAARACARAAASAAKLADNAGTMCSTDTTADADISGAPSRVAAADFAAAVAHAISIDEVLSKALKKHNTDIKTQRAMNAKCGICQQTGHRAPKCPTKKKEAGAKDGAEVPNESTPAKKKKKTIAKKRSVEEADDEAPNESAPAEKKRPKPETVDAKAAKRTVEEANEDAPNESAPAEKKRPKPETVDAKAAKRTVEEKDNPADAHESAPPKSKKSEAAKATVTADGAKEGIESKKEENRHKDDPPQGTRIPTFPALSDNRSSRNSTHKPLRHCGEVPAIGFLQPTAE